ncbi:MAG: pilus assembly protein PilP [Nitrospirae bacterium]|nr:pilus assembly protein PilP [Nitrospirota bacterium]
MSAGMPATVACRLTGLMLALGACLWLGGCGGGDGAAPAKAPTPAKPPAPAKTAPADAKPAATAPAPAPAAQGPAPAMPGGQAILAEAAEGQSYFYRAGGRRDPFRSIIVSGGASTGSMTNPLQQYSVKDLKLIAVIWGQLRTGAMIETPDGKGYTVYVGTTVGNREGVVKQIKPDQLVVREQYTDIFGERKEELVVLDLHLPEEGLK